MSNEQQIIASYIISFRRNGDVLAQWCPDPLTLGGPGEFAAMGAVEALEAEARRLRAALRITRKG